MFHDNRAHAALRDFIAELNAAWEAAGPPSYARLEKLSISFGSSEHAGGLRLRVLAASTTHEILRGKRRSLPEWGWVVSFVNVLRVAAIENGLDPDVVGTVADWKARHQRARMKMRQDGGGDDDGDADGASNGAPNGAPNGDQKRRGPPADRAPPAPERRRHGPPDRGYPGGLPIRFGRGIDHDGQRAGPAAAGRPARRPGRTAGGRGARLRRGANAVAE